MRTKAIITGAIAVLAAAGLTANAQTAQRTTSGTVATSVATATFVAATAQVTSAERDDITVAIRSTVARPATESSDKPDTDARPAARPAISTACQQAINNLKALHQADVAEDAKERMANRGDDRVISLTALSTADRAEDLAEAQQWKNALAAARTACVPPPATACRSAISSLQSVLLALHAEELAELPTRTETDWAADLASIRTAFSAVATACASRD